MFICGNNEKSNDLGIAPMDKQDHIESLSKDGNQLVLCGVGGNGKFAHFVEQHRINSMIVEREISSVMVVTDRDEDSVPKIGRMINRSFENIVFRAGEWNKNVNKRLLWSAEVYRDISFDCTC